MFSSTSGVVVPLLLHQVFQSAVQWAVSPFHRHPVCHHCQRFAPLFAARCDPRSCVFPWAASQHVRRFEYVSTGARSAACCVCPGPRGPDAHRWPLSQPRHVPSAIAVDSRLILHDVSPVPFASLIVSIEGVSVAIGASPSSDLNLLYSGNLWDYLGETQKRRSSVTPPDDP